MTRGLHYGRISWSYDETDGLCRPTPLITFRPIRINGRSKTPGFTDKVALCLFKLNGQIKISFREAYVKWHCEGSWLDRDLGEGRSFLKWVLKNNYTIVFRPHDFDVHAYFMDPDAPRHDPDDEMAKNLSFAIRPVQVSGRNVKLYLQDDDVLHLINLPFGEEKDFLELVSLYIEKRFQWETWKAPAPPFLEWVKAQGARPVFSKGQMGFCP